MTFEPYKFSQNDTDIENIKSKNDKKNGNLGRVINWREQIDSL